MSATDVPVSEVDQQIGIYGLNSSGVGTNPVNADALGNLHVIDYATSASGSAVPTNVSFVGGSDGTLLRPLKVDTSGRLAINLNDGSGTAITVGQKTMADSVPVVIASDQIVPVSPIGTYNFPPPIISNGQTLNAQINNRGALIVSQALDSPTSDIMNRLRVSSTRILGAYCFSNTLHPSSFNTAITGAATNTLYTNYSASRMITTTASGDSVIRQTKKYYRYSPGESHRVSLSGIIGPQITNITKRWGFYDTNDGLFFEQTGTNLSVVIRSSTSGTPTDIIYNQSAWNLDKLDGTGSTGLILDTTKHNVYFIEYTWHGSSRLRFGTYLSGSIVYCHEILDANIIGAPFMRTPYLPIRAEIVNTGTVSTSSNIMDIVCLAIIKESMEDLFVPYNYSKSSGRVGKTAGTTLIPVISIRPTATFNGITNRVTVNPVFAQLLANQQAVFVQIIVSPTLTGASFNSINSVSCVEYDVSSTALSGGTVLAEFYVPSGSVTQYDLSGFGDSILLGLDIAGTTQDILTIAAISTAGGSTVWGSVQWQEFQ